MGKETISYKSGIVESKGEVILISCLQVAEGVKNIMELIMRINVH
jgi:hypothetical protein